MVFRFSYMKNGMIDWNIIRALDAIARKGTLSAAAKELGMSIATLGRLVYAAETAIGISLVMRRSNGSSLTDEGRKILTAAAPAIDILQEMPRIVRSIKDGPNETPIRISSTEPILCEYLAPNLPALFAAMPNVMIEMESSNALSKLNRGEADIAIRMARPSEDTLIALALKPVTLGLYASHEYLKGRDVAIIDLQDETLLAYDPEYGDIAENLWVSRVGLNSQAKLRAGSVRTLLVSASAGAGIALLPDFMAKQANLVRLSQDPKIKRTPWLVYHRDYRNAPKHKIVRRWVVDCFKTSALAG